jgi:hypothetical protein
MGQIVRRKDEEHFRVREELDRSMPALPKRPHIGGEPARPRSAEGTTAEIEGRASRAAAEDAKVLESERRFEDSRFRKSRGMSGTGVPLKQRLPRT